MGTNTRIKAYTIDDLLGIQALHLGIGIQFVEVADTQSQVGISEQFNSLSLGEAHEKSINILLNSTFLQEFCKSVCSLYQSCIFYIGADNDTGRIKVVVQSLALTQEFRAKNNVVTVEFFTNTCCITNRNRRLNHYDCFRVILDNQLDNSFNCTGVKKVHLAIVICRGRDYYKISITICFLSIQSRNQIQLFLCQILFNVFILNRGLLIVNHLHFLRNNVHSNHLVVLRKQCSN